MNKKKHVLLLINLILILSLLLSSCQTKSGAQGDYPSLSSEETASREAFEEYLMNEFQSSFEDSLIDLHYTLKNPDNYEIEKPDKALPSITEEYDEDAKADLLASKEQLLTINSKHLAKEQQRLYETLEKYLDQQIKLCSYPEFIHVLGANSGINSNLPLSLTEYTFYTEEDVKDYLAILPQIPAIFEEAYAWEKNRAVEGYCLADFEIEDIVNQIGRFLDSTDENLFIKTFDTRIDSLKDISDDQKRTYKSNNRELVRSVVIPAFESLKENMTLLKKDAPEGKGLSHYENGSEYYELLIQSMTLSDRSISTLIKTLEKRMDTITDRILKVTRETPDAYDIFYSTTEYTDETPKEMLARLEECIKADYPELSEVTYKVEPIPDALKNNSTAAYYMIPPLDSTEENRIYYGDHTANTASLFMTLAHEGYPGHLYHQNYLLNDDLNPIYYIMDITGYKEAWAYYVEMDVTDYCDFGIYDEEYHDALTELYRCNDEFSYCISSLIDLYVNGKGYSEEEVGKVLTRYGLDSTSGKAFYEFSVKEPGAYLQYYVGYLELLNLRQQTEKKLGDNFNEKEFHTKLLEIGPCYFSQINDAVSESN